MDIQHLIAQSSEPVSRAYSMANPVSGNDLQQQQITLLVRLALPPSQTDAPPGMVSSYLFSLSVGDTVDVSGPFGDFNLQSGTRPKIFIGGGVGMAPLRAMIHTLLDGKYQQNVRFYYGARSVKDLFYQDEFDHLQSTHSCFDWTVALSEPMSTDQWQGKEGFIHEIVRQDIFAGELDPRACEFYLCGPPPMLRAVTAMLLAEGVNQSAIYADDFGG
jgi:Na+-transporting NADH:ubiquinone oxidoreductase subunit F